MSILAPRKLASALMMTLFATSVVAMPRSFPLGPGVPKAPIAVLLEAKQEPTPIGYVMFCMNYSEQCNTVSGKKRVALTNETWALIRRVNNDVNERISPNPDKGTFEWSLTTTSGNCNDYAVQKRNELIKQGISPLALSLSVVMTQHNVGHLVLTVRSDRGDFVLDNLRGNIVAWNRAGYRWVSVQSNDDPNRWVKVMSAS